MLYKLIGGEGLVLTILTESNMLGYTSISNVNAGLEVDPLSKLNVA